jgi:ribosomal protein S12 methylthiotransferase accessory factor
MTAKSYRAGTHRAVSPEETRERIRPFLTRHGITRLADLTQLDTLGIPTYCAIRPAGIMLQVANGKGARPVDAQVSALMEAIEIAHGEEPPARPLRLASLGELEAAGERVGIDLPLHAQPRRPLIGRLEWVLGDELGSGAPIWLPASSAWVRPRQVYPNDWNGLASGNTRDEATLHALYEVLERHVLSGLVVDGMLDVAGADVLDVASIYDPVAGDLAARIAGGGARLVLLRVRTDLWLHAFMAVILDPEPLAGTSHVNVGYGAHLSPTVAATRAITEAAQSRLTFIHGAREDLREESYHPEARHDRLFRFFAGLEPDTAWDELLDGSSDTLEGDLALLLASMRDQGLPTAYRIDLSHDDTPFSVVKVVVPGTRLTIPV